MTTPTKETLELYQRLVAYLHYHSDTPEQFNINYLAKELDSRYSSIRRILATLPFAPTFVLHPTLGYRLSGKVPDELALYAQQAITEAPVVSFTVPQPPSKQTEATNPPPRPRTKLQAKMQVKYLNELKGTEIFTPEFRQRVKEMVRARERITGKPPGHPIWEVHNSGDFLKALETMLRAKDPLAALSEIIDDPESWELYKIFTTKPTESPSQIST